MKTKVEDMVVGQCGREETVVAALVILGLQKEQKEARRKFKCYQSRIHGQLPASV